MEQILAIQEVFNTAIAADCSQVICARSIMLVHCTELPLAQKSLDGVCNALLNPTTFSNSLRDKIADLVSLALLCYTDRLCAFLAEHAKLARPAQGCCLVCCLAASFAYLGGRLTLDGCPSPARLQEQASQSVYLGRTSKVQRLSDPATYAAWTVPDINMTLYLDTRPVAVTDVQQRSL